MRFRTNDGLVFGTEPEVRQARNAQLWLRWDDFGVSPTPIIRLDTDLLSTDVEADEFLQAKRTEMALGGFNGWGQSWAVHK